jgi:hypothetical protein
MRATAMPGKLQRIDIALRDFRNRAAIQGAVTRK